MKRNKRKPWSNRRYGAEYWKDAIGEFGCPRNRCYNKRWWRTHYKECYSRFIWNDGNVRKVNRRRR